MAVPRRDASRACTRAGMTCAAPRREDTRPARLCAAMFAIGRRHLHLVLHQPSLGRRCASLDGCLAVGAAALRRMRRAVRVPCALRSVASSRARRGVECGARWAVLFWRARHVGVVRAPGPPPGPARVGGSHGLLGGAAAQCHPRLTVHSVQRVVKRVLKQKQAFDNSTPGAGARHASARRRARRGRRRLLQPAASRARPDGPTPRRAAPASVAARTLPVLAGV